MKPRTRGALVAAACAMASASIAVAQPRGLSTPAPEVRWIQIQSTARRPVTVRAIGADGNRCGGDVKVFTGARTVVNICGRTGQIAMHDGYALTLTPVVGGRIYEVYSNGSRWAIRPAAAGKY